jgi:hypothetical protein
LVKRYLPERGTDTANALFSDPLVPQLATTPWGFAETHSVLLRRFNDGSVDRPTFLALTASLQAEVVDSGRFHFLPIDDATIFASPLLMQRHNLNATDAAILTMLLDVVPNLATGDALVLVAADTRLLRAAAAERLATLNPQTVAATDVPALLATL